MRGENDLAKRLAKNGQGSPPHARGKHRTGNSASSRNGITPACAGKTTTRAWRTPTERDHPRMRGENDRDANVCCAEEGSPPHARGKRRRNELHDRIPRITPACAGKTRLRDPGYDRLADHPRMRGENAVQTTADGKVAGSPPHARGKPALKPAFEPCVGITPACAGKTAL